MTRYSFINGQRSVTHRGLSCLLFWGCFAQCFCMTNTNMMCASSFGLYQFIRWVIFSVSLQLYCFMPSCFMCITACASVLAGSFFWLYCFGDGGIVSLYSSRMYGDWCTDSICYDTCFGGGCITERIYSSCLCYFDLYISRIYFADGKYVSASAFQHDSYCNGGCAGRGITTRTQSYSRIVLYLEYGALFQQLQRIFHCPEEREV